MCSETPFLGVSRLQDVATTTTSAAGRDHHAERTALALSIRFDAECLLKHFMIAKAINCPRKRVNSSLFQGAGAVRRSIQGHDRGVSGLLRRRRSRGERPQRDRLRRLATTWCNTRMTLISRSVTAGSFGAGIRSRDTSTFTWTITRAPVLRTSCETLSDSP